MAKSLETKENKNQDMADIMKDLQKLKASVTQPEKLKQGDKKEQTPEQQVNQETKADLHEDSQEDISQLEAEIQKVGTSPTDKPQTKPNAPQAKVYKIARARAEIVQRQTQHPERPSEVGEAALQVIDTIAKSDQDPNLIARGIGKIMQFILEV